MSSTPYFLRNRFAKYHTAFDIFSWNNEWRWWSKPYEIYSIITGELVDIRTFKKRENVKNY